MTAYFDNSAGAATAQEEFNLDFFCGMGGATEGMKQAGVKVHLVANHCEHAILSHSANHPDAIHLKEDVFAVNIRRYVAGRSVGVAWLSPSCTHFSRAKGAAPVDRKIRGLGWVAVKLADIAKPKVIQVENVEEWQSWGPVLKRDLMLADGKVAKAGQPDPTRKGEYFKKFVNALRSHGYSVEWTVLNAADFGAATQRKRLFLVAKRDGLPVRWPTPTHRDPSKPATPANAHLPPWRPVAECIDWSDTGKSIFDRKKPHAESTLRRIHTGVMRYVLQTARPFVIAIDNQSSGPGCAYSAYSPLTTVTTENRHALIVPTLVQTGYGERKGQAPRVPGVERPLGTIVAGGGKHALVAAHLTKFRTGSVGSGCDEPCPTITSGAGAKRPAGGSHALGLCSVFVAKNYTGVIGHKPDVPLGAITCTDHHSVVHVELGAPACRSEEVRKFLERWPVPVSRKFNHPLPPGPLGTVVIDGEEWTVTDIKLRMLKPRELAMAQGFPSDVVLIGSQSDQVARIGNSVSPAVARALTQANLV